MKKICLLVAFLCTTFCNIYAQSLENGAIDTSFKPSLDGNVYAIVPNEDGSIIVGGSFSNGGLTDEQALNMQNIMLLTADGKPNKMFNKGGIGFDNTVYSIVRTKDNKLLVVGRFTTYNKQSVGMLVRLMPDGTLDNTFNNNNSFALEGFNAAYSPSATKVFIHPTGVIYVMGGFNKVNDEFAPFVARFSEDGELDKTYKPVDKVNLKTDPTILAAYMDTDGSFFIGGSFSRYGGVKGFERLVHFNADGSLDYNFKSPDFRDADQGGSTVKSIDKYAEGEYLIGGDFAFVNGEERFTTCVVDKEGNIDDVYLPYNFANGQNELTWATYSAIKYKDYVFVAGGDITVPSTSFIKSMDKKGDKLTEFELEVFPNRTPTYLYADPKGWLYVSGLFTSLDNKPASYFGRIRIPENPNANTKVEKTPDNNRLHIAQSANQIEISGLADAQMVSLYTVSGALVSKKTASVDGKLRFNVKQKGCYILEVRLTNTRKWTTKVVF